MKTFLLSLNLLLIISIHSACAEGPVWKISKDGRDLFLAGTIHVLSKTDYPLPPVFMKAYQQAEVIVFETDMHKMQEPASMQRLFSQLSYPPDQELKHHIAPATYQALQQYLTNRGLPEGGMDRFKPGLVSVLLTGIELQKQGLASTGVDLYFHQKAKQDQKQLAELETLDEQITVIEAMGKGLEDEIIRHTLQEMGQAVPMLKALKKAWRVGNNQQLQQLILRPFKQKFPQLYRQVLVQRNQAWLPKIETMLRTNPTELIFVGALHLVGEEGLLQQLQQRGYIVTML